MFSDELQESNEAQCSDDEVVMEVELDEDDELPYVHSASGKCNACIYILIFFTTFHQLLKLMGPSQFLKYIFALCIDSDEVTESEGNDQDDSFFTSQPVAEDLDLGEGMLLVKVILSGANSITHLIMRRLKT